jgi:hypothetical protein
MMHLTPRALFRVSVALACVGCGGGHGGGGGGGIHTANSFSGGSSHSSGSSYGSSSGSHSSSSSSSSYRSGSHGGAIAADIGAAVALKALEIATSGQGEGDATRGPSAPSGPPPRPPSACEDALSDWRDFHHDPTSRVPPQLRCGPNGEWGGEWSPSVMPPSPS